MAEKLMDIKFENLAIDYGLRVWCDLSIPKLRNIDGICSIYDSRDGYYHIVVDKRYSLEDIKNDIWRLAGYEPSGCLNIFGYRKVIK